MKNVPSVFLMTDSQVAEEQFLVLINDLLASGEIPGLFMDDEVENIISSMRPQVKSLGLTDTREACWKFFIEKVRRHLKVGGPGLGGGGSRGPSKGWFFTRGGVRGCSRTGNGKLLGEYGGLPDGGGLLEVPCGRKK